MRFKILGFIAAPSIGFHADGFYMQHILYGVNFILTTKAFSCKYHNTMSKNQAAVAMGKLKRGVKEKKSKVKIKSALSNLEKARAKRWPKK